MTAVFEPSHAVRAVTVAKRREYALRGSQSAGPVHKVLHLPRKLHSEGDRAVPATKSANEPHVQKSRLSAPVTKSELLNDQRQVQSAAPATKTAIEVKQLRFLALSRKVDFGAPKHEASLAPATKSGHHVPKCTRRHNESAVARSARRGHPDFASLRSRNAHGRCREA